MHSRYERHLADLPWSGRTVRLRTDKTRGCLSRTTGLSLVFKLCRSAEKRWRRLQGSKHLAEVIEGVAFCDGVKVDQEAA